MSNFTRPADTTAYDPWPSKQHPSGMESLRNLGMMNGQSYANMAGMANMWERIVREDGPQETANALAEFDKAMARANGLVAPHPAARKPAILARLFDSRSK